MAGTYGLNGFPLPAGRPWSVSMWDARNLLAQARARPEGRRRHRDREPTTAATSTTPARTPTQVALARALTASPYVDLVLGEHAHVVQPITKVNGKWVVYGMGNMIAQNELTRRAPTRASACGSRSARAATGGSGGPGGVRADVLERRTRRAARSGSSRVVAGARARPRRPSPGSRKRAARSAMPSTCSAMRRVWKSSDAFLTRARGAAGRDRPHRRHPSGRRLCLRRRRGPTGPGNLRRRRDGRRHLGRHHGDHLAPAEHPLRRRPRRPHRADASAGDRHARDEQMFTDLASVSPPGASRGGTCSGRRSSAAAVAHGASAGGPGRGVRCWTRSTWGRCAPPRCRRPTRGARRLARPSAASGRRRCTARSSPTSPTPGASSRSSSTRGAPWRVTCRRSR